MAPPPCDAPGEAGLALEQADSRPIKLRPARIAANMTIERFQDSRFVAIVTVLSILSSSQSNTDLRRHQRIDKSDVVGFPAAMFLSMSFTTLLAPSRT